MVGFRAYFGFESGVWPIQVDLPGVQPDETGIYSSVVEGLPDVEVLFVAMVAYDANHRDSGFSNQRTDHADRDHDLWLNEADNCPNRKNGRQLDKDADGVGNACDNCTVVANPRVAAAGPDARQPGQVVTGLQPDQDADGIGNACDCDLDQTGLCTSGDLSLFMRSVNSGTAVEDGGDIDGSGEFSVGDLVGFLEMLDDSEAAPGPTCIACAALKLGCEGPGCPPPTPSP